MGKKPARMEKVLGSDGIKFSIVISSVADHPQLRMISRSRETCFSAGVGKQQVPRLRSVLRCSGGRTFARNERNLATKSGSGATRFFSAPGLSSSIRILRSYKLRVRFAQCGLLRAHNPDHTRGPKRRG